MEHLSFKFNSRSAIAGNYGITAGVVNSGNLEILITKSTDKLAVFEVLTTVSGYAPTWEALLGDFAKEYACAGLSFILHDSGATPAIVSLRLRQAYEKYSDSPFEGWQAALNGVDALHLTHELIYLELSARERILALTDPDSFNEFLKPGLKYTSPHLAVLDLPTAFDDGVIIGEASLKHKKIYIAAQNHAFMGGAIGEINGAKLTGLCLNALKTRPSALVLLLDSGGVRLQEANAGEIAISEIIAALMQVRYSGIPVYGIVAGRNGAFGGIGIISQCLDKIIITENARTGISGPEVIETVMGTDEYDASDRALVWRTCGGRERASLDDGIYVSKSISALRESLANLLSHPQPFSLASICAENELLHKRLQDYATCSDGIDIWAKLGFENPSNIPNLSDNDFLALLKQGGK